VEELKKTNERERERLLLIFFLNWKQRKECSPGKSGGEVKRKEEKK